MVEARQYIPQEAASWRRPENAPTREIVQYEIGFDQGKYKSLYTMQDTQPAGIYEAQKEQLDSYTRFNLITALGERFHTGLSTRTDVLRDGVIYGQNSSEPLLDIFVRGRDYRKTHGSSFSDQKREHAEVVGFEKIQSELGKDEVPEGTIMLSISGPGGKDSMYQHNFYDMFVKKADGEIDVRRYSSALSFPEYLDNIQQLTGKNIVPQGNLDAYLLANPIKLSGKSPEQIHRWLHRTHKTMDAKDFQRVVMLTKPLMDTYLSLLAKDPTNTNALAHAFNMILKQADFIAETLQKEKEKRDNMITIYDRKLSQEYLSSNDHLSTLRMQGVRVVNTGCGVSGGAEQQSTLKAFGMGSAQSAMSVADFGTTTEGSKRTLACTCPFCSRKVEAEIGDGKIKCPSCKKDAPYQC